jgi:glycosyltransferase involved in cell wall biosynthesis
VNPVASVVIPAHDEAERIGATLRTLLTGIAAESLEVVVVCNGCSDGTADGARAVPGVQIIEIDETSKIAALRAGDAHVEAFPRIYLDADVAVSGQAAAAIARALDVDEPRVAGLLPMISLRDSSRYVRSFYRFRQRLPVFQGGIVGAGVYAMNEAARTRFGVWPAVIGDDQFVLRLFEPHERIIVRDHRSFVEGPPDLRSLVRRGVRVRRGNAELTTGAGGLALAAPPAGVGAALRSCASEPSTWPGAVTWLAVSAWVRILTRLRADGGDWAVAGRRPGARLEPR